MRYALAILAASAAVVHASPMPVPQGVTAVISPQAAAPSGCSLAFSGTFGIAVMNITTTPAKVRRQATQLADGQPNAGNPVAPVTQISDGQVQATTAPPKVGMVSQITDGQIQAPTTHAMISAKPVSQISDGQPQVPPKATASPVSVISDGQPQAPVSTAKPVSVISDGQPQAPVSTAKPVSVISDGQPQAPVSTAKPVSVISDGQPQAPQASTAKPVTTIADGQPQAPPQSSTSAVAQGSDGQPAATPATTSKSASVSPSKPTTLISTTSSASTTSSVPATSSSSSGAPVLVACQTNSTLALTLANGVLKDSKGRTGYIASNFQFQFDNPPQAGAIFTSGFSVCGNGSLALGGSNVFWQCRSGGFFNLYDRNWAPQCSPVTINTLTLEQC